MTWAPLLLTFHTASVTHARLIQLPSVSQNLRHTATLTCTGDSNNGGNEGTAWLQQHQGRVPRVLTHRNNYQVPGISERFSGSRSGSTASLTISELQPEDEADYFCTAWDSSASTQWSRPERN
ncbi:Ig lambda chain V-I region BL2 [Tupaia chinensis]|uniref:Ig lambda chain V-I region BL2 n=1 Tax=Tupaia chinensis TaxID=246437 RepID=L8YB47_TUPCH|nr:Ig lambda chain V-I region BL2 [Tupaia chinensis]